MHALHKCDALYTSIVSNQSITRFRSFQFRVRIFQKRRPLVSISLSNPALTAMISHKNIVYGHIVLVRLDSKLRVVPEQAWPTSQHRTNFVLSILVPFVTSSTTPTLTYSSFQSVLWMERKAEARNVLLQRREPDRVSAQITSRRTKKPFVTILST